MSESTARVLQMFMTVPQKKVPQFMQYLTAHYGFKFSNFVHDEVIVEEGPELTEEQLNVIAAEVRVLLG